MSALDPAGPAAAEIAWIWWVMFWPAMAILALTAATGLYVVLRTPARRVRVSQRMLILGGGIVVPGILIAALLGYGLAAGRYLSPGTDAGSVTTIDVTAHQWWWEVRYTAPDGTALFDANEIHVRAGTPVEIRVTSADVIHSFWIPRLGPKIDAVPGITNRVRIEADRPGIFRGQCSEFCGLQHAGMVLHLVAHEDDASVARRLQGLTAMRGASAMPEGHPGLDGFRRHCAGCHSLDATVRGTELGPNLAGVTQRRFLGAAALGNGPAELRHWLADHQSLKPGNRMPSVDHLDPDLLEAIVQLLEGAGP
jgi:cytochrome c oxidase subunit 2